MTGAVNRTLCLMEQESIDAPNAGKGSIPVQYSGWVVKLQDGGSLLIKKRDTESKQSNSANTRCVKSHERIDRIYKINWIHYNTVHIA
jgi:hypothetical protein